MLSHVLLVLCIRLQQKQHQKKSLMMQILRRDCAQVVGNVFKLINKRCLLACRQQQQQTADMCPDNEWHKK